MLTAALYCRCGCGVCGLGDLVRSCSRRGGVGCPVRAGANCLVCLQPPCFPPRSVAEETTGAVTPDHAEVRSQGGEGGGDEGKKKKKKRRGGRAATCGRLVWGEPNGFSLIGRAICHSWDGLRRRIPPLKGRGETGIEQSQDRGGGRGGGEEEPEVSKSVVSADLYLRAWKNLKATQRLDNDVSCSRYVPYANYIPAVGIYQKPS